MARHQCRINQKNSSTEDRFGRVVFGKNAQVLILKLFKSLIDFGMSEEIFKMENSKSLTVTDIINPNVSWNSDIYRRIMVLIHYFGLNNVSNYDYPTASLYRRIIRELGTRKPKVEGELF